MTKAEVAKLFVVISEAFPRFLSPDKNSNYLAHLWQICFEKESYTEVENAFVSFYCTDTKGFPPVPGQLKEIMARQKYDGTTDQEAWSMVQKAIRNSNYNSVKEFKALPKDVQKCVGSADQLREWASMSTETVNSVISSNFKRSYRARASFVREYEKLPPRFQRLYADKIFASPDDRPKISERGNSEPKQIDRGEAKRQFADLKEGDTF